MTAHLKHASNFLILRETVNQNGIVLNCSCPLAPSRGVTCPDFLRCQSPSNLLCRLPGSVTGIFPMLDALRWRICQPLCSLQRSASWRDVPTKAVCCGIGMQQKKIKQLAGFSLSVTLILCYALPPEGGCAEHASAISPFLLVNPTCVTTRAKN